MILELEQITQTVGGETHLFPLSLKLVAGGLNVLLGPTQAGKTTLMRVMAGLDRPHSGRVLVDGKDVTGVSVRDRNLAMVYQQFINYPGLSVFENIAAPLRLQRCSETAIKTRVQEIAAKLHIDHLLDRLPGALSGGQQQRCALARALIKRAPLVLLDEPLVNLDYKLREELRAELTALFADGNTTVVYATTEPQEALLLGGHTAVLNAGRLLQFGPTLQSYNHPASIEVAAIFNDPPMNMLGAVAESGNLLRLDGGALLDMSARPTVLAPGQRCRVGVRCNHVRLTARSERATRIDCKLDLAELSGSETYLHLHHGKTMLVSQLPGIHALALGAQVHAFVHPEEVFLFDSDGEGRLLSAPSEN